jgi:putative PIN family toxin of toxin-antitoxin system
MTEGRRPQVVLDCMTYLQGAASPKGPAAACLRLLEQGVFSLFFSADILREVTNVLSRPKLRQKNPLLTDERVREFIEQVRRIGTPIDPVPSRFSYPRDPKDEPYLNLALACDADYLVSWDNDLLDLMTSTASEAVDFRALCPHLAILTPPAFLRAIAGSSETLAKAPSKPVVEDEERRDDSGTQ